MAQHLVRDLQALLEREERLLVLAVGDTDDERVEEARCTADQILMAAGERIEGTWINGYYHCRSHEERPVLERALCLKIRQLPQYGAFLARKMSKLQVIKPCFRASCRSA